MIQTGKQKQQLLREFRQIKTKYKSNKKKVDKEFRRQHLLDQNNPFDDLFYWSREVRIRDEHKCVQCGRTRKLTSHHLFSKSKYPGLKYNLANGLALCFVCHSELHLLNDIVVMIQTTATKTQ